MFFGTTVRGESISQIVPAPWTAPPLPSQIANGAVVSPKTFPKGGNTDWRAVVDPVNAVIASTSYEWMARWNDANSDPSTGIADCGRISDTQDYDAAGRLLGQTHSTTGSNDIHCDNGGPTSTPADIYLYDAENHHIGSRGGSWSPTGRAYNLGGTSIHYDGAVPLFGTDAQGNLSIKIEQLADIDSAGRLTVWDRDYAGLRQTGHNDVVYFAVNLANVILQPGSPSTMFNGSTNATQCGQVPQTCGMALPFLPYNRMEGFDYLGLTFQGVRAIDNSTGGWTTPDAYSGDVHDPMSQKAFMWDRNNPYEYADPTGYYPQQYAECSGCWGHGFQSLASAIWAPHKIFATSKKKNPKKKPGGKGGSGLSERKPAVWPELGADNLPSTYEAPKGGPVFRKGGWIDRFGNSWEVPHKNQQHGAPHFDVQGRHWERNHPGDHNQYAVFPQPCGPKC